MLEGLDQVPWAELTHAYGSAEDVPDLLRSIAAGGEVDPLFGNLWHQGTVFPATAPAVPFVLELALAAAPATAGDLLEWLGLVANGVGYLQVHGFFAEPERIADDLRRERDDVVRCHAAVCALLPRLTPLLFHPHERVRSGAIQALAAVTGVGDLAAAELLGALAAEPSGVLRARVLDALAGHARASAELETWRRDPDTWSAPLGPDRRRAILRALDEAAASGGSAVERVVAGDALVRLGCPYEPDEGRLASDLVEAAGDLVAAGLGRRALFVERPTLRAASLTARLWAPAPLRPLFFDLHDLVGARGSRTWAVGLAVALLRHPDPDTRRRAANEVHHLGVALRPHADAAVEASSDDPLLSALVTRPLRLLGHPEGTRRLEAVLRGDDDRALLHLVELVGVGDPPEWAGVLADRRNRIDPRATFGGAGSAFDYAAFTRSGASAFSDDWDVLRRRLGEAIARLEHRAVPAPDRPRPKSPIRGSWESVDRLREDWASRGDADAVLDGLVHELIPRRSGLGALALLEEVLAAGAALPDGLREQVEALRASDEPLVHGTIEQDEQWLAGLDRVRAHR